MSLDKIYLVTKIIISISAIIGIVSGTFWKWYPRFKSIFIRKKTLLVVNNNIGYSNFWQVGFQQGKPILQINCRFIVTNITDRPIALSRAIWKGKIKGHTDFAQVLVKDLHSIYWGNYTIPPFERTNASVSFFISTTKMPKQEKKLKLSIGIVDQSAKVHWVRKVRFFSG